MDVKKSKKPLSDYRSHMAIREGLSFSDYFDDSVPYEVKPPLGGRLGEEEGNLRNYGNDYPVRAKNLFKGLWEDALKNNARSMMPDDMETFKSHLAQLFSYLKNELKIKTVPKVKLMSDEKNAAKVLGKTAYYDPDTATIVLYTTNRHQKDVLRSFAHEIIHHWQHENEKFQTSNTKKSESSQSQDPQYAQHNPWLRQMEKQAFLLGNLIFRDWEDKKKAKDRKSGKKNV